jgi:DNA-binding response OmpR family regulator
VRILVVEDDSAQRDLLTYVLRRGKHEVTEADGVAQALAARGPFDLVLCDWSLNPGTAREVRAGWLEVPFVVMSGYPRPDGWNTPWVMKPISPEGLVGLVAAAMKAASGEPTA